MTKAAIERATDALWDHFCPGIRRTPADDAHYRAGIIAVLESLKYSDGIDEDALLVAANSERLCPVSFGMAWDEMLDAHIADA